MDVKERTTEKIGEAWSGFPHSGLVIQTNGS